MILMSSTFGRELRWVMGNVGLALVVAFVATPLVSSIYLATDWPSEGWSGSAIETYLGSTLLLVPYVVILGAPALAAVLVTIRFRRPSRLMAILLAVIVGDGLFTALLTRPFDRDPGVITFALTALLFLPLWAAYGAILWPGTGTFPKDGSPDESRQRSSARR